MLKEFLIFVGGVAVGTGVGYYVSKRKFEKEIERQVADVKDAFEHRLNDYKAAEKQQVEDRKLGIDDPLDSALEKPVPIVTKKEKEDFFRPDSENVSKSDPVVKVRTPGDDYNPDPSDITRPPFPIKDVDFGDQDDTCDWIVFADGVVCADDSLREVVNEEKVHDILGDNWQGYFGWDGTDKYIDQLYMRNNVEKVDVSICKDLRTYKEWLTEAYPRRAIEEFPDD